MIGHAHRLEPEIVGDIVAGDCEDSNSRYQTITCRHNFPVRLHSDGISQVIKYTNSRSKLTVSPTVTTNYSVTVTDGQGCTQTASRQVIVRDVRCGNKMDKVQVCRIFPRESRTLCVSPVQAYVSLLLGASLGSCEVTAVAGAKEQAIETTGSLNVKVTPNPSNYFFTMVISGSNSNRPISVRVMDGASRLVEARSNIASKTTIQLGHQYRPGIYYAEVIQGGEKVIVKMIKQP